MKKISWFASWKQAAIHEFLNYFLKLGNKKGRKLRPFKIWGHYIARPLVNRCTSSQTICCEKLFCLISMERILRGFLFAASGIFFEYIIGGL